MKKITWLLFTLTLLLIGCGDNPTTSKPESWTDPTSEIKPEPKPDTTHEAVTPGRIAMARAGVSLAKMVAAVTDSGAQHLGTQKMSGSYFFEVANTGGAVIEGLEITTSDSAFIMSPGLITKLETTGNSSFSQILRLDVIHGTAITNGQAIERLLPYGRNTFTVYFDGTTLGEPFHAEFEFSVDAIYLDITPKTDTATGNYVVLAGKEREYQGEECTVYINGKSYTDTLSSNIIMGTQICNDADCDEYMLDYRGLKTDCAVKQLLPKELQ